MRFLALFCQVDKINLSIFDKCLVLLRLPKPSADSAKCSHTVATVDKLHLACEQTSDLSR
jgi:hypothetical protein